MNIPALSTQMAAMNVSQQVGISGIRRALDQVELMGDFITEMMQNVGPADLAANTIDVSI